MIGIVLLTHEHVHRTAQLAKHLTRMGCKVVVHIDARVHGDELAKLQQMMGPASPNIAFAPRVRCDWGTFSLVDASLGALRLMMTRWPEVTHVCQLSGSCLPIKPIAELERYLQKHRDVDFIECVPTTRDTWVVDGLADERFTLFHPLPWRRYRRVFDLLVEVQRRLGVKRKMPDGLVPHLGSQWWCLSRRTVDAILNDPALPAYRRFFKLTWIPDESFFQTLAAKHSDRITSAPLTFVRFDLQGKPYTFYDDHLDLLLHADGYFARKIWAGAGKLYSTFLSKKLVTMLPQASDGARVLARFEKAQRRHQSGRRGLINHGCHPGRNHRIRFETARPYLVLDGFARIFPDLEKHMGSQPGVIAHGEVFHPDRVEFADDADTFTGNLSSSAALRDHKPEHFLSKLIWVEREKVQVFQHDLTRPGTPTEILLADPNAFLLRLQDRWVLDLYDLWLRRPGAVARAVAPAMARESDLASSFRELEKDGRGMTLTMEEVIRGGVAIGERVAAAMPDALKVTATFPGARLPDRFGAFLRVLDDTGQTPKGMTALKAAVQHYEDMTKVLSRKT